MPVHSHFLEAGSVGLLKNWWNALPPTHLEKGRIRVGWEIGDFQVALHNMAVLIEPAKSVIVVFRAGGML